jgi:UDP-glucose 4-epimerase
MTKNVLLTGGFGTLGGRLAAILAQDSEINLRLASRIKRGAPHWAPRAETYAVDFEDRKSIQEMLNEITHVVHLVAMTDFESRAEPEKAEQVNTEYTNRVIEQCSNETRFVYLSTIQVYGADLSGTITESTPTNPADAYSQTHLSSERELVCATQMGSAHQCLPMQKFGKSLPTTYAAKPSRKSN